MSLKANINGDNIELVELNAGDSPSFNSIKKGSYTYSLPNKSGTLLISESLRALHYITLSITYQTRSFQIDLCPILLNTQSKITSFVDLTGNNYARGPLPYFFPKGSAADSQSGWRPAFLDDFSYYGLNSDYNGNCTLYYYSGFSSTKLSSITLYSEKDNPNTNTYGKVSEYYIDDYVVKLND